MQLSFKYGYSCRLEMYSQRIRKYLQANKVASVISESQLRSRLSRIHIEVLPGHLILQHIKLSACTQPHPHHYHYLTEERILFHPHFPLWLPTRHPTGRDCMSSFKSYIPRLGRHLSREPPVYKGKWPASEPIAQLSSAYPE